MKLNLIESLGNRGVITGGKPFLRDKLVIEVPCAGVLTLSAVLPNGTSTQRGFKTNNGTVTIDDYDICQGTSRVHFNRGDGVDFDCGELSRNSRFINFKSNSDELVVALAIAYAKQEEELKNLKKDLSDIKTRYGISII